MQIIFLNGPPGCGKDHAATVLGGFRMKMAKELKERTHAACLLFDRNGRPRPHDFFEAVKDKPNALFGGSTPRAAYIAMSEGFIKPIFGDSALGMWLADSISNMAHPANDFLITDSGFRGEAEEVVDRFGAPMCTLLRIHRAGYDYSNDSRGYIDLSDLGVRSADVDNLGDESFLTNLKDVLSAT
tara:strand:- start:11082 stop:11636 length:555 start_codon:yes stop_codon:yes gene_type:complete